GRGSGKAAFGPLSLWTKRRLVPPLGRVRILAHRPRPRSGKVRRYAHPTNPTTRRKGMRRCRTIRCMTDDQLLRYSRHILLDEIGIEGQQRLLASHALVVGAGGLGSPVALYLGTAGVGRITLVD